MTTAPTIEALTRRLLDTPRDVLAEPVGAPDGQVVVAAVVSDVVRLHGGPGLDTVTAAPFRLPPAPGVTPVRIAMAPGVDSLNVAMAATVALAHLRAPTLS